MNSKPKSITGINQMSTETIWIYKYPGIINYKASNNINKVKNHTCKYISLHDEVRYSNVSHFNYKLYKLRILAHGLYQARSCPYCR